jgi:hypothetical protein
MDGRNRVPGRKRQNLFAPIGQECIACDDERANAIMSDGLERGVDRARRRDVEDNELQPKGRAASCKSRDWSDVSAMFGLTSRPTVIAVGTNWCSSSSRFGPSSALNQLTPVTLPPGRLRLATRPYLRGSSLLVKTIGIVLVAALATIAGSVPPVANHSHPTLDEIGREHWQSIRLSLGPSIFNRDVLVTT